MTSPQSQTSVMARRYSSALFELTEDAKSTDAVLKDLMGFSKSLGESEDLKRLTLNPLIAQEDQMAAIKAVAAKAGAQDLTTNFLSLITQNRRLFAIADIIEAFRQQVADSRGEVVAEVTSAQELTKAQMTELANSLKKSLGKEIQLNPMVDASILGGLIVRVGSKMIDTSIRTKLENLKIAMREVG